MIQIIKIEKISTAKICSLNPFMTEAVSKSMDWFLYDNGLRHERVKWVKRSFRENVLPRLYLIDTTGKSLNSKKVIPCTA